MTATEELMQARSRAAASRFFLRVGQAHTAQPWRDEHTLPLFPLTAIMEAEGLLATGADTWQGRR